MCKSISRYGYTWSCMCRWCGSSLDVEIHHIDGHRNNNSPGNLVPLCRKHHDVLTVHKVNNVYLYEFVRSICQRLESQDA